MIKLSLLITSVVLAALGLFVWRARSTSPVNRSFAGLALSTSAWAAALATAYSGFYPELAVKLSFLSACLIPATFLRLAHFYPACGTWPSTLVLRGTFAFGLTLAIISLTTPLVAFDAVLSESGLERKPGPLYPLFAVYFVSTFAVAATLLTGKWRRAHGLARAQLQYLVLGIVLSLLGGTVTNLVLPFVTGRSSYAWAGPFFGLIMASLVAHAIIRHRLMDLRLVIHRGLTLALAMLMSLVPVVGVLAFFWPRLSDHLDYPELAVLLVAIIVVTLLIPPTRNVAARLLDRYVYRTHANYRHTVRDTSQALTRSLNLHAVLSLVSQALAASIEPAGISVYLRLGDQLQRARAARRHDGVVFSTPETVPPIVTQALDASRNRIILDEVMRDVDVLVHQADRPSVQYLCDALSSLNWALVLPLLSEDAVIGGIALGPKLSGDPFYPQDLDLLMTLANQAGVAIKNAQLYTQVVLANEYIENIVATIESGVVAVDSAGHITMFNRKAEQLTGLPTEHAQRRASDLLPEPLASLLAATVVDGHARTQPEIALPDGTSSRPVICTTSPLRDPAGTILGAVAVFSDLTPLKDLESERQRAERLAYFETLASSLAHEIKNPLVAIKTFTQLIARRHQDERFVDEFSRVVSHQIGRMEHLVERLRMLSRPSDRPRQLLDVRAPLRDAVEFLQPAFDEKRITVQVSLAQTPCVVLGDASELEQLFINLLMNAHEATPPDGAVSIDLSAASEHVAVAVADSGPGIPPDLLDRVFDPFITTKQRGSGLGLTICAGISTAHRAKLHAANRPAGGAVFTVEFPVAATTEALGHQLTPRMSASTSAIEPRHHPAE